MVIAHRIAGALLVASVCALLRAPAAAADAPAIESIVDRDSGAVLWSTANPSGGLVLKPGEAILLKGRNFGPGPLTAAQPGLGPPAGGAPPDDGRSIVASPPEAAGKELSKVLFGTVRALERNLSSYRARIGLSTILPALLSNLQSQPIDLFYEPFVPVPDTWAGDIYGWSDTEIDLTVPITAYEGPIQVVRIPVTGAYVADIASGKPLLYQDPNTARVVKESDFLGVKKHYVFLDRWRIARTGEAVLASNAVPATIELDGEHRLQVGPAAGDDAEARAMLAAADTVRLVKAKPTLRSAADQYAYGERAYWAYDWNLAFPHLVLGVDWDGIFGFDYDRGSLLEAGARKLGHLASGISEPAIESTGYSLPVLGADGAEKEKRLHKAMIDRITGEGIRPLPSFGAIPLLPDAGADRVIAPPIAFEAQPFAGLTPYPITMAFEPIPKPLTSAQTKPTGWAGYVFAEVGSLDPTSHATADWIGFNCAACHAARVTYEYEPGGKRVSRFFSGIPNPDWRATFLALSGRAFGLALKEPLPTGFIGHDHPEGIRQELFGALDPGNSAASLGVARALSWLQRVDKTLLLYNLPPGATESTLFNPPSDTNQYGNDYFFSPQAIPIITNHTPVRRALSRSELIDGFEGAYLHGEEPEGARGPMSARSLQDLTLYDSTLHQDDEPLRRIGLYRWLAYKNHVDWLGGGVNEGTFVSFGYQPGELLRPPSFPPPPPPASGLNTVRDAAFAGTAPAGGADPFAQRFPDLAQHIGHGAKLFQASCGRCHASGNAGLWTNEDMHPISAAGGSEPTGRFFSPTAWQRQTQSIRTSILENLFWLQQRGLLSDGHVVSDAPDNMDGLDLLVRPERCQAPLNPDGSVDLARASDLYKRLYTIHPGPGHSYRIPGAGMRFELYTRFGDKPGVLQQVTAADSGRTVTDAEARFVARQAYFTRREDGYYYWDYQKMRREYGILEYGLDPANPAVGGLPAAPHPWCMPEPSAQADIDDLVAFLLTL